MILVLRNVEAYPIHSSIGGKFGGLSIKGDARNFSRSSTEYTPAMVSCLVAKRSLDEARHVIWACMKLLRLCDDVQLNKFDSCGRCKRTISQVVTSNKGSEVRQRSPSCPCKPNCCSQALVVRGSNWGNSKLNNQQRRVQPILSGWVKCKVKLVIAVDWISYGHDCICACD